MKAYVIVCGAKSIIGFDEDKEKYVPIEVKYEKSFLHSPSIRPVLTQDKRALIFPSRSIAESVLKEVHIPNVKLSISRINMDMRTSNHISIFESSAEWLWRFLEQ